jgi:hypothetical protein
MATNTTHKLMTMAMAHTILSDDDGRWTTNTTIKNHIDGIATVTINHHIDGIATVTKTQHNNEEIDDKYNCSLNRCRKQLSNQTKATIKWSLF